MPLAMFPLSSQLYTPKRPTETSSAVKPLKSVRDFRDVFVFETVDCRLSSRFLKGELWLSAWPPALRMFPKG